MSNKQTTKYEIKIGESFDITGVWIWGGAIRVAGFPGEVLWLNAGRAGENLNALEPVPFMFFALERGQLVDITERINIDAVSSVITRNVTVGDFNRDGLPDIFLANHGTEANTPFPGEQNRLLIQTPDGKFKDGTSGLPSITDFTHVPGVGDLNKNGSLDFYINNLGDDENTPSYILINDGNALFEYYADSNLNKKGIIDPLIQGFISSPISAIVDVDMDGQNDILFGPMVRWDNGTSRDDGNGYLRNNNGKFELIFDDRLSWPTGSSNIFSALTADLNNDGFNDVVIAGGNPADSPGDSSNGSMMVQVYLSRPDGLQNVSSTVLDLSLFRGIPIYGGIDLEIADIDGNGSFDIEVRSWVSNFSSQARWTFLNDGFGNFGAPIRDLNGVASSKGAYVDLNGDGIKDFAFPLNNIPWDGGSSLSILYGTKNEPVRFFRGSIADDLIVGASGFTNTAIISLPFEQLTGFEFTSDGKEFVIESPEGRDTLVNIQRLQFADINVALDLDGTAGQAYRIYEAVLGRAPDLEGLGYWINDMDNGVSLTTIAQGFIASPEFQGKYGVNPSYETYVNLLYQNILDRAPDEVGLNYWLTNMQNGVDTPAAVLASFSEGYENTANVAPDIANGIYYDPWL